MIYRLPWPKAKSHYGDDGPFLERVEFDIKGVRMRVSLTRETGPHTLRSRYRVECVSCNELLHKATTSASARCRDHLKSKHGVEVEEFYAQDPNGLDENERFEVIKGLRASICWNVAAGGTWECLNLTEDEKKKSAWCERCKAIDKFDTCQHREFFQVGKNDPPREYQCKRCEQSLAPHRVNG